MQPAVLALLSAAFIAFAPLAPATAAATASEGHAGVSLGHAAVAQPLGIGKWLDEVYCTITQSC